MTGRTTVHDYDNGNSLIAPIPYQVNLIEVVHSVCVLVVTRHVVANPQLSSFLHPGAVALLPGVASPLLSSSGLLFASSLSPGLLTTKKGYIKQHRNVSI